MHCQMVANLLGTAWLQTVQYGAPDVLLQGGLAPPVEGQPLLYSCHQPLAPAGQKQLAVSAFQA